MSADADIVEPRLDAGSTRSHSLAAEFLLAFAYWQQECGHPNAIVTPKRRRAYMARRKEGYTQEQCFTAIDGNARAGHVDEKGVKHDEFELIFRSGEKLELNIKRATAQPSTARKPGQRESASDLLKAIGVTP
jgi:hypothetical protein